MPERAIEATLVKIKEDARFIIYEIEMDSEAVRGSLYVDRCSPVFDKLVLTKEDATDGP